MTSQSPPQPQLLHSRRRGAHATAALLLASLSSACTNAENTTVAEGLPDEAGEVPGVSANARPDMAEMLLADIARPRHSSDGGGRAWIETEGDAPARAEVGVPGTWTVVYEAGPEGIAAGGMLGFLVDPFWYWSTPQPDLPSRRGYTEVTTEAEGVQLVARTLDQSLLGVFVEGRDLREGEEIRIVYGAGGAGALPDRYADRSTHFWIRVDGDGDGVSGLLAENPTLDVAPGPAAALQLTLPSTGAPGESVRLTVAALDNRANALWKFAGALEFTEVPPGVELPTRFEFPPDALGRATFELTFPETGLYRVGARLLPEGVAPERAPTASSNPCLIAAGQQRILWADLHGHSNLTDGTGTPEDYFTYARDVAALDIAALTDHDHWGVRFVDQTPEIWESIKATARAFHEPERFVTLLAYEWTSWLHGHRHVLYFGDDGQLFSSIDPDYDDPRELWDALRGESALTFAHHSAGGPIATNWDIPPDPELEPVTEIVSVHGSSEALDSPGLIYSPVPGNFVRDVLDRGFVFGFVGSGDGHDGHPGLAHLMAPGMAGVAAILADDLTHESVLEALRARRCYATNGPRILLRTSLDGRRMGSSIPAAEVAGGATLAFLVIGTGPVESVDVIRSGEVAVRYGVEEDLLEVTGELKLEGLTSGEYVYLRAVQTDRGAAWSSPFYIE